MGKGITNYKLTKKYILSKVSQITIFSIYFDLPVKVINNCINTGELICSPIRDDNHPTCGFRYDNKGKLKFRDFAGYFWGDCFDAVALIVSIIEHTSLDIYRKEDFMKVLRHISFTFMNIFYGKEVDENLTNAIKGSIDAIRKQKPIIEVVCRDFNNDDMDYWKAMNVTRKDLMLNHIFAVEQFYIDRKINPNPKYYYDNNDPCYAYYLGKDRNNIHSIKLYFPKRKHGLTRFITNCNHLEGICSLTESNYDIIVLTKSTKDRVCISANLNTIHSLYGDVNIGVINIPHETYKLRGIEYKWLNEKLTKGGIIVSLMDNDRTGMCEARWLRKTYKITPIIIPKEYNSKDFSELVINNNFNTVKELILTTINKTLDYAKELEYIRSKEASLVEPF